MRSLAQWCVRHRFIVIALWIAILVVANVAKSATGTHFVDSFGLSNTDSAKAQTLLAQSAPRAAGGDETIVFAVSTGTVQDRAVRTRVSAMFHQVEQLPGVASIASPYASTGAGQIAKDGSVAFATVKFSQRAQKISKTTTSAFVKTVRAINGSGLQVEISGDVGGSRGGGSASSTGIGILAALVVMLFIFGSVLAAITPLVTAIMALGVGTAITGMLSNEINMASFSTELALLIGLGVGVDYALFIVTRMRQAMQRGVPVADAIVESIDTSGRAVLFAGITVCIALLGLFTVGISFLYGVAIAASITVACTVLTALTLLPALLSLIGPRVFSRRQRRTLGSPQHGLPAAGFWTRWSATVQRRPIVIAVIAGTVLACLAVPYFSMRLGSSDDGSNPTTDTSRRAYDLLAEGFGPGYNGPLMLVAKTSTATDQAVFSRVAAAAAATPGVAGSTPVTNLPGVGGRSGVSMVSIYPKGSPQDASTTTLLHALRDDAIPKAEAGSGLHVLVGGSTATSEDFADAISSKLPQFIAIVVALSFILLAAVFRSLLVPAIAAVMNILTAMAGFGILTAIFQWGWGLSLLGIDKTGPIEAFVPVMMFAITFGLSMDYQVFLVSRIFEEWHRTHDNSLAITRGLAATGRTITAAATIMVLVFGAFILGGERIIELFGIGLSSAVALDAVVVRSALVPALMRLAGPANWWLPAWLDRVLPALNVEGSGSVVPAEGSPERSPDDATRREAVRA